MLWAISVVIQTGDNFASVCEGQYDHPLWDNTVLACLFISVSLYGRGVAGVKEFAAGGKTSRCTLFYSVSVLGTFGLKACLDTAHVESSALTIVGQSLVFLNGAAIACTYVCSSIATVVARNGLPR